MLTFYYHPLSPISRRVWLALLELEIPFEPVIVDLRGKQFEPDFLSLNPFHHVPVIEHGDVRLIESVAILDYLDGQFAQGAFSPQSPAAIARMRMVQMVVTHELMRKLVPVVNAEQRPLTDQQQAELETCFQFLAQQLGGENFFGEQKLNLADFVVGATVPLLIRLGCSLTAYPALSQWAQRLSQRAAWQLTQPSEDDFQQWKRWVQLQTKRRLRAMARR